MRTNNELYDFYMNLDRSLFINNEYKEYAHYDSALPIGHSQTISQPSLVYEMTSRLNLNKESKVLEVGTGSGYQTTFLAQFSKEVYTVERIDELSELAKERLKKLGYDNVRFKVGDGSKGWREYAPYDRIIVTAGAGKVPDELVDQLGIGGRMLIPVGKRHMQELILIERSNDGDVKMISLGDVMFVELKGDYGWEN